MRKLWVGASILLSAHAAHAVCPADESRSGDDKDKGVCCPKDSKFDGYDCVSGTPNRSQQKDAKIQIVPDLVFVGGKPKGAVKIAVNGVAQSWSSDAKTNLTFDIDSTQTMARVDVQGDDIYDTHTYVPVAPDRVIGLPVTVHMFPNVRVTIDDFEGGISEQVYVECPALKSSLRQCSLDKDRRVCVFRVDECDRVMVRLAGSVNATTQTSVAISRTATTDIAFKIARTSHTLTTIACGLAITGIAVAIPTVIAGIATSDEWAMGIGSAVGVVSLGTFGVSLAQLLAPPVKGTFIFPHESPQQVPSFIAGVRFGVGSISVKW